MVVLEIEIEKDKENPKPESSPKPEAGPTQPSSFSLFPARPSKPRARPNPARPSAPGRSLFAQPASASSRLAHPPATWAPRVRRPSPARHPRSLTAWARTRPRPRLAPLTIRARLPGPPSPMRPRSTASRITAVILAVIPLPIPHAQISGPLLFSPQPHPKLALTSVAAQTLAQHHRHLPDEQRCSAASIPPPPVPLRPRCPVLQHRPRPPRLAIGPRSPEVPFSDPSACASPSLPPVRSFGRRAISHRRWLPGLPDHLHISAARLRISSRGS